MILHAFTWYSTRVPTYTHVCALQCALKWLLGRSKHRFESSRFQTQNWGDQLQGMQHSCQWFHHVSSVRLSELRSFCNFCAVQACAVKSSNYVGLRQEDNGKCPHLSFCLFTLNSCINSWCLFPVGKSSTSTECKCMWKLHHGARFVLLSFSVSFPLYIGMRRLQLVLPWVPHRPQELQHWLRSVATN